MRISDLIAQYIIDMLEEANSGDPSATIKRNELAETLGCVPSQINYVITSRFTPEQGYIVESRRGGGGYIKITRIQMDKHSAITLFMEKIDDSIDAAGSVAVINELLSRSLIDIPTAKLLSAAASDRPYHSLPTDQRDKLRAAVLKDMLLVIA